MTRHDSALSRTRMSAQERKLRSALHQLLHRQGVVHGSLLARKRVCGKSNCRCTKGQLHESLYLIVTEDGKGRQMYVPKAWEALVRQWIDQYAQARRLLDELSRLHWDKVRTRQD